MAAITGESIFGSGSESSDQARRKAVLVKAAKLGIKTRGMRLLQPGDGGGGGGGGGGRAAPRRTQGSHPSRGTRTSGVSAEQRSQSLGGSSNRRQKRPRPSGTGDRGDVAGVDVPQGLEGDTGVVTASEFEVAGGNGGDDRSTAGVVDEHTACSRAVALPSKKRRKRGASSSKSKSNSSSAATAASNHGGLAAIASLY